MPGCVEFAVNNKPNFVILWLVCGLHIGECWIRLDSGKEDEVFNGPNNSP
jgi:hypothetical protein